MLVKQLVCNNITQVITFGGRDNYGMKVKRGFFSNQIKTIKQKHLYLKHTYLKCIVLCKSLTVGFFVVVNQNFELH